MCYPKQPGGLFEGVEPWTQRPSRPGIHIYCPECKNVSVSPHECGKAEEPMAAKPTKESDVVVVEPDPKAAIEAFKATCAALEPLATKGERARVLGAVAILFGIEEQKRYDEG